MKQEYISNNIEETNNIAKEFVKLLHGGDIVLLRGDLGAGKTAFVKAVVKALNGDENLVTSPTFTIVNEYMLKNFNIYHFDLYRIKQVEELFNIGIEEYFYSSGVCFIEWPERAEELFIGKHKVVTINKIDENTRSISFEEIC